MRINLLYLLFGRTSFYDPSAVRIYRKYVGLLGGSTDHLERVPCDRCTADSMCPVCASGLGEL